LAILYTDNNIEKLIGFSIIINQNNYDFIKKNIPNITYNEYLEKLE
jgi:hypothetical protein